MPGLIYDLIDILEKESEYYSELLNKSKEKTQIVIENDVDKIRQIASEEQIIASKVIKLEKQRDNIISDICLVLNATKKNFTITKLIEKLDNSENEQKRLIEIREEIICKINELKRVNEKNKLLIEQALGLVDFTLNAINSKREYKNNDYKYGGKLMDTERGNSFFDAKQ
ncbi:MAG TPA: hypothetical protein DEP72_06890 [Clostridiales bacterium]|nr:MAG: hypothetical protein A2Y18_08005 [Clostridiales bacterium GWD2_32_19]HCC07866.1 hypothetical protein [Clostridiales bacterium]